MNGIQDLQDWKQQKEVQQISYPLDDVSRKILEDDLNSYIETLVTAAIAAIPIVEGYAIGDIRIVLNSSVPTNWFACTGTAISRTTYSALFAKIGTTWGTGDGSTTFNVPNFQGKFLAGYGANGVTTIGTTGGVQTNTISKATLPSTVTFSDKNPGQGLAGLASGIGYGNDGGGGSLDNMPPYAGVLFIIKIL